MQLEEADIVAHDEMQGGYRLLTLAAPAISSTVRPGQFVHLAVPGTLDASLAFTLRRPFSVYRAEKGTLRILYKDVGRGTHTMTAMKPGQSVSILGPLGRPFPPVQEGRYPVLVAGGYGMAALYLVATGVPEPGVAFVGGKSSRDILCVNEFKNLGWEVRIATEDGSQGSQGLVTEILDVWSAGERGDKEPEIFACGPAGMLRAVGERAETAGWTAWLSMDRDMGCGVGACLTCVQKVRLDDGSSTWARICKEGPVFECRQIVWEEETNG